MAAIDPSAVAVAYIERRVDKELSTFRVSVNVKQLASMTGASTSTLEKTFLPLPYVRELEHRVGERGGKRVWLFPEITQAWRRYLDEREV